MTSWFGWNSAHSWLPHTPQSDPRRKCSCAVAAWPHVHVGVSKGMTAVLLNPRPTVLQEFQKTTVSAIVSAQWPVTPSRTHAGMFIELPDTMLASEDG